MRKRAAREKHGRGNDAECVLQGTEATMRVKITLECTECKQRNYDTVKNKKNDPDRLELKKYCRFCRKETLHKETK
jgi:large subunit ribosomal protein L33